MKKFCKDLRKHATKIISCNKKEVIPLTKREESNYSRETNCHICNKKGFINYEDDYDKKYYKVKYKVQKEIPIVFHNGSTYDYHFIIKELAK